MRRNRHLSVLILKKEKKVNSLKVIRAIVFVLLWVGQIAAEIWAGLNIQRLDMVPKRLFIYGVVVLLLLWIFEGLLFFYGNGQEKGSKKGSACRLASVFLIALTVLACIYSFFAVDKVQETVRRVTEGQTVTRTYAVYVRSDDPAEAIEDAENYKFGFTSSYDKTNTAAASRLLRESFSHRIRMIDHDSVQEMVDELFDESVDAILLNEAYVPILQELEGYENFSEDTRVIHRFVFEERSEPDVPEQKDKAKPGKLPTRNLQPVSDITTDPFVVYLSGSDTRSQSLETSNSDVNILVIVNPQSKQILLLNTPRDYYIPNPAGGGELDKLTHCGMYGIDNSIDALSDLYDVVVNYYAQINFTGFQTLIDAVGGVTVESEIAFTTHEDGIFIQQGVNKLNGEEALSFVRERYAFASGDNQRGLNQMKVLSAVIEKLSAGRIITHYNSILSSLQGMFLTSISGDEISSLVKMQLDDGAEWNIKSFAVTGNTGNDITYSIPRVPVSVMYQNETLIKHAADLVDRVIDGETLMDEDVMLETPAP